MYDKYVANLQVGEQVKSRGKFDKHWMPEGAKGEWVNRKQGKNGTVLTNTSWNDEMAYQYTGATITNVTTQGGQ
jgi:hypothetical protein